MPQTLTCDWQMSDGELRLCPHHRAGEKCVGNDCPHRKPCMVAIYAEGIKMWVGELLYAELVKNKTIADNSHEED